MDSSDDEGDTLEAMKKSDLGGASMNHEEPENERFENGVRQTIEFEEALGHLNLKHKLGDTDAEPTRKKNQSNASKGTDACSKTNVGSKKK